MRNTPRIQASTRRGSIAFVSALALLAGLAIPSQAASLDAHERGRQPLDSGLSPPTICISDITQGADIKLFDEQQGTPPDLPT